MAFKNTTWIGGGYVEAVCTKCGEVFVFAKGDDIFARVDENQDVWPYCSKCYEGPRADKQSIEAYRRSKEV